MMAKSLAVLVAMVAMTAVPAFAQQEAQDADPPVGPVAGGQYAPEAAAQGGEACILPTYPEQPCPPQGVEGSGQYAPGTPASSSDGSGGSAEDAFAGVGVVESLGGDGRYGLRLGPLEGQELRGDFDFAGFEGETVRVSGRFAIDETRGRVLQVEGIELAQEEGEDCTLTTYPEQPCPPQEVGVPADATTPEGASAVVSGDTSDADGSGNASVDASGGGAVRGSASTTAKVLPATGGVLPIAGVAGLVVVAGGLLVRGKFVR